MMKFRLSLISLKNYKKSTVITTKFGGGFIYKYKYFLFNYSCS